VAALEAPALPDMSAVELPSAPDAGLPELPATPSSTTEAAPTDLTFPQFDAASLAGVILA
jgi:hypothetical protein